MKSALGIRVPRVEDAMSSADADYYSLLVVALLERGAPMTRDEVAVRFEEAGVASACDALASLKRRKPARAPIYRDGDDPPSPQKPLPRVWPAAWPPGGRLLPEPDAGPGPRRGNVTRQSGRGLSSTPHAYSAPGCRYLATWPCEEADSRLQRTASSTPGLARL